MKIFNWWLLLLVVWSLTGCAGSKTPDIPENGPTMPVISEEVTTPSSSTNEASSTKDVPRTPSSLPDEKQATATLNPQFSQLQVVYIKDGQLWRWTPSGERQITFGEGTHQPVISPDGKLVAYLRQIDESHAEIWVIDLEGENEQVLVSIEDLNTLGGGFLDPDALAVAPYQFEWIPGTHLLAFNTQQIPQGPGQFLLDDFHLVDADTLELKPVLLPGWGGMFKISPDGSLVAISTPTSIILTGLDGSNYRELLPYEPVNTYSGYRFYAQPIWQTNSDNLWVAIPPTDPLAEPLEETEIWEISASDSRASLVGTATAVSFIESPLNFSPDANHLVYLRQSGEPKENSRELVIAKPGGADARVYQTGYLLQFIGWSADSKHFLYALGENQEPWLGSLESEPISLSKVNYPLSYVSWIDQGNFITARILPGQIDLYLANLNSPARLLVVGVDSPPAYDFHLVE